MFETVMCNVIKYSKGGKEDIKADLQSILHTQTVKGLFMVFVLVQVKHHKNVNISNYLHVHEVNLKF